MSHELTSETRQAIIEELKAGRKIGAIKLYREHTECSLKAAKDFIEELTNQLIEQDPEAFQNTKSGCGTGAVLFVALFGFFIKALYCC